MRKTQIDFLNEEDKIFRKPARKTLTISKIIIYLLIIFIIIGITFSVRVISSGENLSQKLGNLSLWGQIKHLMSSKDKELAGEKEDRINVLLLGIGGAGHDGPYLTDTIIIASFKPSTKKVAFISVPRDLLAPIPGHGWQKINHANAFGEAGGLGQGGELASQVTSEVFGIPIHYYLRIDFAGFVQIIDDLDGIRIEVENTLDDELYPVKGKETATTSERYEHLYIPVGSHYMNGELALKYVRSRQAKGIEGSDFARSQRQQKVLLAIKDKGLTFTTLINPYKISRLMDTLSQHLQTNLKAWEILRLFQLGKNVEPENIIHRVLDDSPGGLLYAAITEDGAFVLRPKAGDFSELQYIAQNLFDPELAAKQQPKRIEIQNGTKISGLAVRISQYLQSLGYQITKIGNAPTQDYQKTVIYNLVKQEAKDEDQTANILAELLKAEVAPALPEWVSATTSPQVGIGTDILIILGQDQKDL